MAIENRRAFQPPSNADFGLPTAFQPPFQPRFQPPSNTLPTPFHPTPHTPQALEAAFSGAFRPPWRLPPPRKSRLKGGSVARGFE